MKESRKLFLSASLAVAFAIILFASGAVTVAHAQTFTMLYNFGGSGDADDPYFGPIAQGRDGNLYTTTSHGGSTNSGTVFMITPTGALTVLSNLGGDAGSNPEAGVTLGRDGNFYGAAESGGIGHGTVFQLTPEGKLTVLYSCNGRNGTYPTAAPIQGADGNLYGTTTQGGNNALGTIYKITPHHHLTPIYHFTGGSDGRYPSGPLLHATDGSFYGSASNYAFKISPAGAFTSLGSLPADSNAPLIQASNGDFYGITWGGGTYGEGTVFQMTRTGKTGVLHSFNSSREGANPIAGLVSRRPTATSTARPVGVGPLIME